MPCKKPWADGEKKIRSPLTRGSSRRGCRTSYRIIRDALRAHPFGETNAKEPQNKWSHMRLNHEDYNAGYFFEFAVAHPKGWELMRPVLTNVVKDADYVIPPPDCKEAFARKIKCLIITRIWQCGSVAGKLPGSRKQASTFNGKNLRVGIVARGQ